MENSARRQRQCNEINEKCNERCCFLFYLDRVKVWKWLNWDIFIASRTKNTFFHYRKYFGAELWLSLIQIMVLFYKVNHDSTLYIKWDSKKRFKINAKLVDEMVSYWFDRVKNCTKKELHCGIQCEMIINVGVYSANINPIWKKKEMINLLNYTN